MPTPTPCLWFDGDAEPAAQHYLSIFPESELLEVSRYGETGPGAAGSVLTVRFRLGGQEFLGLNGGVQHAFTEAVSFTVDCADQAEVDHYWSRLGEGGEEGRCGWVRDRFGLWWQVVPDELPALLGDPDAGRRERAMAAMMRMSKLDVDALRRAADDVPA